MQEVCASGLFVDLHLPNFGLMAQKQVNNDPVTGRFTSPSLGHMKVIPGQLFILPQRLSIVSFLDHVGDS